MGMKGGESQLICSLLLHNVGSMQHVASVLICLVMEEKGEVSSAELLLNSLENQLEEVIDVNFIVLCL